MSKKKALGRGLSALLSDNSTDDRLETDVHVNTATQNTSAPAASANGLQEIAVEQIEVNPFQPRSQHSCYD